MEKIKNYFIMVLLIFLFAFLINFLWESIHAIFLYTCCLNMRAPEFVRLISYASLIDSVIISGLFIIISFISGPYWIKNTRKKEAFIFIISALIVAIWIEYRGVYLLQKWQYSDLMPIIFGIGLSPMIQLIVTGFLTLSIAKNLSLKFNTR